MTILFKFASRSRPYKFLDALTNINEMVSGNNKYIVLASLDWDDPRVDHYRELIETLPANNLIIDDRYDFSKNKIDAINRDMDQSGEWDILINMSDDMKFIKKDFDVDIVEAFKQEFYVSSSTAPLNGGQPSGYFYDLDQFIHFNDGNQKDNVCTMSIMGREYYDRQNYIYNPEYQSLWCDVEETEKAYMLGKYKYMGHDKILFRHLHPAWGLCEWDEQYRKTEDPKYWSEDKAVIDRRRQMNYYLKPEEIVNGYKYGVL